MNSPTANKIVPLAALLVTGKGLMDFLSYWSTLEFASGKSGRLSRI